MLSAKTDSGREASRRSQLIVEDPAAYVQQLKQRLQAKEGIPSLERRLIFRVPQQPGAAEEAAVTQPAAEEVLGELSQWQAIVFQNGKAIGRLLSPQLSTSESHEDGVWRPFSESAAAERFTEAGVVVETISIQYDQWQPVWAKASGPLKQLYLPVDNDFTASLYRIQVIGRSGGRPFAVPFAYTFSGKRVSAAISLEVQRSDYIQRHQLQRGSSPKLGGLDKSEIAVECGRGLEGFTAVFDAVDEPAWLKCVVLRFAVVARGLFDDALPQGGKLPMSVQENPTSRLPEAAAKPQKPGQPEASVPGSRRGQHQAAMESWLPKLPAPSSSKKPKAKRKANRGGFETPKQPSQSEPEQAEEPMQPKGIAEGKPGAQPSASLAKSADTELKLGQKADRGSNERLEQLGRAKRPQKSLEGKAVQQAASSAGVAAETEPTGKQKADRGGANSESAARTEQSRVTKGSDRPGVVSKPVGPMHDQPSASTAAQRSVRAEPRPAETWVPVGVQRDAKEGAGHGSGAQANGVQGSKRLQKAESWRKGRRNLSSADVSQAAENHAGALDHALHYAGGSQTGTGSTKQTWTQSSAGSGGGDGGGASSDEEDDRDSDHSDKQQRGTGSGQGGDDGDHSRRWHKIRGDDEEAGHDGEEDAGGDEDLSDESLKTAVSDTPVPSGSEDSRSAVPMQRLRQGAGAESSSADTRFDSLESERGMSEEEEVADAAAALAEKAKRAAAQPRRLLPLAGASEAERREAGHPAVAPPKHAALPGRSTQGAPQPRVSTEAVNVPLAAVLAQPVPPPSASAPREANGSAPGPVRQKSVPALANKLPSIKVSRTGSGAHPPGTPLSVVGTPTLASSSVHEVLLEAGPRWAPAAIRPAPPPPATLAQTLEGGIQGPPLPIAEPIHLPLPNIAETPLANGAPGPLPVPVGIPMVPIALSESGHLMGVPNTGAVLAPNGPIQTARQRSLSESAPSNADWISRSYGPATTTWAPNPPARLGPLPAEAWYQHQQQQQHHGRAQPRPSVQQRPAGPQVTQAPRGPAMSNGFSRDPHSQLYQDSFGDVWPTTWNSLADEPAFAPPTRPFSATGHRPGLMMEAMRLYDPAIDCGAFLMAVQDPPQTPTRNTPASPSFDAYLGSGMGPPPPPPPREEVGGLARDLGGLRDEAEELAIERQGSFQVPGPPPQATFEHNGPPANDLEQLISCITPVLEPCADAEGWKLADVWQFYEEASSYGREVYTRSGRRGAALAYYWPMLSAVRLLGPAPEPDSEEDVPAGTELAMPLMDFFETEPPFLRVPLCERVAHLSSRPHVKGSFPPEGLNNLRLDDLHPASWYAVAWYPVYRIPDAPLTAKFLTYHSLRPVSVQRTLFGALDATLPEHKEAGASPQCIPIVGLKCAERKAERWLDNYEQHAAANSEWKARLAQLGSAADRLTRSKGLLVPALAGGWEERHIYHSDQDWFNKHP